MNNANIKTQTISSLLWKLTENFSAQVIGFLVQILLARILLPEDYGVIALSTIIIAVANVFIQTGFGPAVIQKKEISDLELNSVFFIGMVCSTIIYILIFISSPLVAGFFSEPKLVLILRIQSIVILVSSLSSIHNALLVRGLNFKKFLKFRIITTFIQGIVGISMALSNYGVWSLVVSNIISTVFTSFFLILVVKWKPKMMFSFKSTFNLLSYSSKVLYLNLSYVLYNNIVSLVIGKSFSKTDLGFYNKGNQIPTFLMVNTDGAINTVMFPVLSKYQDRKIEFLSIFRRSLTTSAYLIFPMMIGLSLVARPLISIILTDKWLPSAPYVVITSITCMTWVFSIRTQAFNSLGRSDISLKLNFFGLILSSIFLMITVRKGIYVMLISFILSSVITILIGVFVSKRVLEYSIRNQINDVYPSLFMSLVMGVAVYLVGLFPMNNYLLLTTQGLVGIFVYIVGSHFFRIEAYVYLLNLLSNFLKTFSQNKNTL